MNTNVVREVCQHLMNVTTFIKDSINNQFKGSEPWYIVLTTVATVIVCQWLYSVTYDDEQHLGKRIKLRFFSLVRRLPIIRFYVKKELGKVLNEISAAKLYTLKPGMSYLHYLPKRGRYKLEVIREVNSYLQLDQVNWSKGMVSGTVYGGDAELTSVISDVFKLFAWSNPLHPDVFPAVRKMEAEIVRMSCNLFHGSPTDSCGCVTAGGTDSILLACKTYRDWAYERGIKKPELICPFSAHAAFEKAAHYFRMKLIHVPVDPATRKVDLHAMKRAITKNTCMLVGSTPQFPHGTLDPIEDIASMGLRYGIPVHVDACLGGFLLPFMEEAGYPIPPCDFRVPGVTSISADTHKYGYAPKGSSVVMYSSKKWIHYQYFVSPDWQGGIYATPMLAGSRSGAIVAACWAAMIHVGHNGYVERTRKIISTARHIENGLRNIKNIFVFGKPEMSVVAIGSLDFDIFHLSSALVHRGWNLNSLQFPSSIHLCCTMPHTQPGLANRFINDVGECVAEIMKAPLAKVSGAGAMYGMAQAIPDRSIVSDIASAYLNSYYDASSGGTFANGDALCH